MDFVVYGRSIYARNDNYQADMRADESSEDEGRGQFRKMKQTSKDREKPLVQS